MDEIEINTMTKNGRVYMNKYDVIKFLEMVRKDAMSNECRLKLRLIINAFMKAE